MNQFHIAGWFDGRWLSTHVIDGHDDVLPVVLRQLCSCDLDRPSGRQVATSALAFAYHCSLAMLGKVALCRLRVRRPSLEIAEVLVHA